MSILQDVMTRRPRPLTNLTAQDQVVLFPSLGYLSRDKQHWIIDLHGDVYAPSAKISLGKKLLLRWLKRSMRASDEDFASELFLHRINRFLSDDRGGRRIAVEVGDHTYVLTKKSHRNGHIHAPLRIPISQLQNAVVEPTSSGLKIDVHVPGNLGIAVAKGYAHLLPPHGVSIISDIDDTLKHSYVACKRTLLTNTFLRPFETIPGMSALFQDWSARHAAIHYISSSPWQLYDHLQKHLAAEGFPAGTFHLRAFRLRDHLLRRLLMVRRSGKAAVIRNLIKTFPERQFILVGDSGEHDPEIYGSLARRFPDQIAAILIRQLDAPVASPSRYLRAFRGVEPSLIQLFRTADELATNPNVAKALSTQPLL